MVLGRDDQESIFFGGGGIVKPGTPPGNGFVGILHIAMHLATSYEFVQKHRIRLQNEEFRLLSILSHI